MTKITGIDCQGAESDLRRMGLHPDFWYPFALAKDLKPKSTLGVMFGGEQIVLVRTANRKVFALEDRCPHRQVPLHLGVVEGEQIQCGYHGWCFNNVGKLVRMPYVENVTSLAHCVRTYPCREEYGLIFVFPGNPARADEVAFPILPTWDSLTYDPVYLSRQVDCHYSFMHENLMDQNHQFLHRRLLGNLNARLQSATTGDNWVEAKYALERTGGKQIFGARFLVGRNDQSPMVTIRTEYPYQTLTLQRPRSNTPDLQVWIAYVPLGRAQKTNHSFGVLMLKRIGVPGFIHLVRPAVRYFTEKILAEDRTIVEAEQRAYDQQNGDWNQEVFPVILELRRLLRQSGVPFSLQADSKKAVD